MEEVACLLFAICRFLHIYPDVLVINTGYAYSYLEASFPGVRDRLSVEDAAHYSKDILENIRDSCDMTGPHCGLRWWLC